MQMLLACSRWRRSARQSFRHPAAEQPAAPAGSRPGRRSRNPQRGHCPHWPCLRPAGRTGRCRTAHGRGRCPPLRPPAAAASRKKRWNSSGWAGWWWAACGSGPSRRNTRWGHVHAVPEHGAVLQGDVQGDDGHAQLLGFSGQDVGCESVRMRIIVIPPTGPRTDNPTKSIKKSYRNIPETTGNVNCLNQYFFVFSQFRSVFLHKRAGT